MNPVRVTPPSGPVVLLDDLKAQLRVSHDDDDATIVALEKAAVAHLDGWRGQLGRCILAQTWRLTLDAGRYALPFPDVTAVVGAEWNRSCRSITLTEAGDVEFTCELPEDALDAVKAAIVVWVRMRFDNLEGPAAEASRRAFDSLVGSVRWIGL